MEPLAETWGEREGEFRGGRWTSPGCVRGSWEPRLAVWTGLGVPMLSPLVSHIGPCWHPCEPSALSEGHGGGVPPSVSWVTVLRPSCPWGSFPHGMASRC